MNRPTETGIPEAVLLNRDLSISVLVLLELIALAPDDESQAALTTMRDSSWGDALEMRGSSEHLSQLTTLLELATSWVPWDTLDTLQQRAANRLVRSGAMIRRVMATGERVIMSADVLREWQQSDRRRDVKWILQLFMRQAVIDADDRPAEPTPTKGSKKVSANAKMLDLLLRKPEAKNWTTRQFGSALGVSVSTVNATDVWKTLMAARVAAKHALADRQGARDNRGKQRARL